MGPTGPFPFLGAELSGPLGTLRSRLQTARNAGETARAVGEPVVFPNPVTADLLGDDDCTVPPTTPPTTTPPSTVPPTTGPRPPVTGATGARPVPGSPDYTG